MINKCKSYVHFLNELAYVKRNEWQVAIRKRTNLSLYDGNGSDFHVVKNTIRYWFADPFLFSHNEKDYLFVEMFDRWKEKGVIGVCRIRNQKCGRFRVCLELPWHLSYPCIYEDESGIHMIPECYQSGEVWIYHCVKFPYRWEKERKLIDGFAVDTTPCFLGNKRFWLTTQFPSIDQRKNDNLWQINDCNQTLHYLTKNNYSSRCAGHFVVTNSHLIRPSQNCQNSYGQNLIFNYGSFCDGIYCESPFLQVFPPNAETQASAIAINCSNSTKKYSGIHTYNTNDRYEVIDLRLTGNRNLLTFFKNYMRHIVAKTRK